MEAIYYSRVEYVEKSRNGERKNIILLDLINKELSYQEYKCKLGMPAIKHSTNIIIDEKIYSFDFGRSARIIRNEKNEFKGEFVPEELWEQEVVFSYGIKLTDEQINKLLPYCNALDFEPYRDRKMSMDDEGYIGYRDEITLDFTAITDSYIPQIELSMEYYYDEEHIWPSEKLYRYLIKAFFENDKKLKGRGPSYGEGSLFF